MLIGLAVGTLTSVQLQGLVAAIPAAFSAVYLYCLGRVANFFLESEIENFENALVEANNTYKGMFILSTITYNYNLATNGTTRWDSYAFGVLKNQSYAYQNLSNTIVSNYFINQFGNISQDITLYY